MLYGILLQSVLLNQRVLSSLSLRQIIYLAPLAFLIITNERIDYKNDHNADALNELI